MQKPKHFEYATSSSIAVTAEAALFLETLPEAVNIHGLRGDLWVHCPTTGGAVRANWALICRPEVVTANPSLSDATFNGDVAQSIIWASGTIIATRETPGRAEIVLNTSRSCEKGSTISLAVRHHDDYAGTTPDMLACCGITWWETQI